MSSEKLPKLHVFFDEVYIKFFILEGEGPNLYIFKHLPLNKVFDMYTQNCMLESDTTKIMFGEEKPHTIWTLYLKYMGYKLERSHVVIFAPDTLSSQLP